MPFRFAHCTKSFAWKNIYTGRSLRCLWGRGGSQQLEHVVGRGGSLGCLETNQSLELVGDLPLFCPVGDQQGLEGLLSHFPNSPRKAKSACKNGFFFPHPRLNWTSQKGFPAGSGLLVVMGCYGRYAVVSFTVGVLPLYCVKWQVGAGRNRLFGHQNKSGESPGTSSGVSLPTTPTVPGIVNLKTNSRQLPKDQDNLDPGAWTQIPPSWTFCIWGKSKVKTRLLWRLLICPQGTSTETV